jgi:hypothetical protein
MTVPPLRVVGDEPAAEPERSAQFFLIVADHDRVMKKSAPFSSRASRLIQDFLSSAPQGLSAFALHQCLVDQGLDATDASKQLRRAVDRGEVRLGDNLQLLAACASKPEQSGDGLR